MPGFNPDKLNIHDLTVEEPEKQEGTEMFFDPEKYIAEKDWEFMRKTAKKYGNGNWEGGWPNDFCRYLQQLDAMKILGHPIDMSDRGANELADHLDDVHTYDDVVRHAALNKKPLKQEVITNKLKLLKDSLAERDWHNFTPLASSLILAGKKLNITSTEIDKINSEIKYFFDKGDAGVESAVEVASDLRIIKNDYKFPGYMINAAMKALDELHGRAVTEKKPSRWLAFSQYASRLAILSADEIRITKKDGLELIHHKKEKLAPETPPLPEQRNF